MTRAIATRLVSCAIGVLLVSPSVSHAQGSRPIPRDAAVFVDEMDNGLDGFIRAVILDKKLPLTVVLKREEAHLVISGESTATRKAAWHEGWLTGTKDRTEGSLMVFDRATKKLLMAAQAGDRSMLWGNLSKGGQRKIAERLVDKIKDNIAKTAVPLSAPPPLAPEEMQVASSSTAIAASNRMTNKDVIDLVAAGMSDQLIIAKIRASAKAFDTSTEALIALKKAKVSEAVISEMVR